MQAVQQVACNTFSLNYSSISLAGDWRIITPRQSKSAWLASQALLHSNVITAQRV